MEMNQKQVLDKILVTTLEIEDKFPELYVLLKETPLVTAAGNNELDLNDFREYLNTIQVQLQEKKREQPEVKPSTIPARERAANLLKTNKDEK